MRRRIVFPPEMETSETDKKDIFRETQDWQKSKAENMADYLGAYSIMAGMAGIFVLPAMVLCTLRMESSLIGACSL